MLYPKAVAVIPMDDYMLEVSFSNGEKRIFDVKPYLHGEWFSELFDKSVFNTVRVAGLSIAWAGGQDIAPDCLYANSISLAG